MNSLCVLISLSFVVIATNGLRSHVFGGNELLPYSHKHLVKLDKFVKNHADEFLCSGSIIGPNWILSAAHCFEKITRDIKVLHHNPEDNEMECIAMVKPSGITIYPGFIQNDESAKNIEKDLALLKTSRRIKYNEYVHSIKMAKISPRHKQTAIMAGYGMSEFDLPEPREGMISILLSSSCPKITNTNVLCSYSNVKPGGGDSGGPLVSENRLVGVISAVDCSDEEVTTICMSYYVNVAKHLGWIEKNMSRK